MRPGLSCILWPHVSSSLLTMGRHLLSLGGPDQHVWLPISSRGIARLTIRLSQARRWLGHGTAVAVELRMLKLLGSYALAKLLGFGLFGALVIYALMSLLT